MRITVVTPVFPTSASPHQGIYIYNTVRSLQRHANVNVVKSTVKYPLPGAWHSKSLQHRSEDLNSSTEDVSVRCKDYPGFPVITRSLNSISCSIAIKSHIKSLNPDLILAYWIYPEGHAAIKVGHGTWRPGDFRSAWLRPPLCKGAGRYLAKRALKRAARVLTVSEDLRAAAISLGASAERVKTIPNGCDRSIFYLRDRAAARAKLGINPDARLVLFVGWLAPLKGVPELVAAFSDVRRKFANAELVCIGEGPLKEALCSAGSGNGVRALGSKTSVEIAEWLGACDLLCLPSRSEGCPNVVVEALSSGRPVIATQVGGIPELIDDNSGIMVPFGDASKLSSAISAGLSRNWDQDAIAARMSRSWDQVADETYGVCLDVLAERKQLRTRNFPLCRPMNSRTIAKNSFWYGIETLTNLLLSFFTSVIIARSIGPEKLGYFLYMWWVAGVAGMVGSLGIPAATRKYMSEYFGRNEMGIAKNRLLQNPAFADSHRSSWHDRQPRSDLVLWRARVSPDVTVHDRKYFPVHGEFGCRGCKRCL